MIYLSQMLGEPVYDVNGEKIGRVNDLGIATGEVFPRVTALAVEGPGKTPFMISWRKYVVPAARRGPDPPRPPQQADRRHARHARRSR